MNIVENYDDQLPQIVIPFLKKNPFFVINQTTFNTLVEKSLQIRKKRFKTFKKSDSI